MVVRTRPSLRHPTLRGDPKSSEQSPAVIEQRPTDQPLQLRSKRARIPWIGDQEHYKKRPRIESLTKTPHLKIPLRSRQVHGTPKLVLPNTKPVLSSHRHVTPSPVIEQPTQRPTINLVDTAITQKNIITQCRTDSPTNQNEKRALRSQNGGSRSKSELAMYFNNYEELLSLGPAKPGTLTVGTRITLLDDLPGPSLPTSAKSRHTRTPSAPPPRDPFGASKPLHDAQVIDLTTQTTSPRRQIWDPLDAEIYHKAHRKAERQEKQLRNIEKERAQHEKVQLDRLLEELKGPDWLRVMGISGVTESEKKLYEPKRAFFIKEVAGLIEKFRHWKEEEKRRKIEREQALAAQDEKVVGHEGSHEVEAEINGQETKASDQAAPTSPTLHSSPTSLTSPRSDLDALAARQLHNEVKASSRSNSHKQLATPLPPAPQPYKPFTSFYTKRHLRDAAVAGHRRGRRVRAFGELVPELEEAEFELPSYILTEDAVRAQARKKRRLRRGSTGE